MRFDCRVCLLSHSWELPFCCSLGHLLPALHRPEAFVVWHEICLTRNVRTIASQFLQTTPMSAATDALGSQSEI